MKFVYFITSHKNPDQILRLCATLRRQSPLCDIVIHHDPAATPLDTASVSHLNIRLVPQPIAVLWGDFTLTQAILNSFRWINENLTYDWLIYISGQDYPLRPLGQIEAELSRSSADAYVYAFLHDDPNHWPRGEGHKRYYFKYYDLPRFPYYYKLPSTLKFAAETIRKIINATPVARLLPAYRNRPPKIGFRRWRTPFSSKYPCWGGYNWMTLRASCVEYIVQTCVRDPALVRHYKRSLMGEESLFQTLLYNSRKFKLENNCRRHIYWDKKKIHAASPNTITAQSKEWLLSGQADFARKFDITEDVEVLNWLDGHLRSQSEQSC